MTEQNLENNITINQESIETLFERDRKLLTKKFNKVKEESRLVVFVHFKIRELHEVIDNRNITCLLCGTHSTWNDYEKKKAH
jgi:hypothetical protein